jgi:hypothetical protein
MSFRQDTLPDYVEETPSNANVVDYTNHLYENQNIMKDSLNCNNKFNEKYVSDDEVVIRSDIENSIKFKNRRSSSEHKRKIKLVQELKSNRKELSEDSVNNLHISNEFKDRIKVNKFNTRPFVVEKNIEHYQTSNKNDELIFKKCMRGTFFKNDPIVELPKEIKKKVEKEFDYEDLLRLKPSATTNKKELLIRSIPGEEKLYSNIQRLKRRSDKESKQTRIENEERATKKIEPSINEERKGNLSKSFNLDLSLDKSNVPEVNNRSISNNNHEQLNNPTTNIRTIILSTNTNNLNCSLSKDQVLLQEKQIDILPEKTQKYKSNGNSIIIIDSAKTQSKYPAEKNPSNTISPKEHDTILYKFKTSIMDERTNITKQTKVDQPDDSNNSFIELIVANCYNKVITR